MITFLVDQNTILSSVLALKADKEGAEGNNELMIFSRVINYQIALDQLPISDQLLVLSFCLCDLYGT